MDEEASAGAVENVSAEAKKLHESHRNHLLAARLAMHQELSRGLLAISSGALGVYIAKSIDAGGVGHQLPRVILISACCFGVSIVLSIIGFHLSSIGIDNGLKDAEAFYLKGNESAFGNDAKRNQRLTWFLRTNSIVFCLAVVLALIGLHNPIQNKEGEAMSDKPKDVTGARMVNGGYVPPLMQRPLERQERVDKAYPTPTMMRPAVAPTTGLPTQPQASAQPNTSTPPSQAPVSTPAKSK